MHPVEPEDASFSGRFVKRFGIKYFVKWDVAPSCEKPDPSAMAEYILENTRPGSIILLHDGLEGETQDRSDAIGKKLTPEPFVVAARPSTYSMDASGL